MPPILFALKVKSDNDAVDNDAVDNDERLSQGDGPFSGYDMKWQGPISYNRLRQILRTPLLI